MHWICGGGSRASGHSSSPDRCEPGRPGRWPSRRTGCPAEACADLDAQLSGHLGMMPWGRFQRLLTAAVLDADPDLAVERQARAKEARDVLASESEDGLKLILARVAAGDALWFMATINRLAEILGAEGDVITSGSPVRRSESSPNRVQALALLARHQHDSDLTNDAQSEANEPVSCDGDEATAVPSDDHAPYRSPSTAAELLRGRPRVGPALPSCRCRRACKLLGWPARRMAKLSPWPELRDWLTGNRMRGTVRPTWRPADEAPIDALRNSSTTSATPSGSATSLTYFRRLCTTATMDLDHTLADLPDGRRRPDPARPGWETSAR